MTSPAEENRSFQMAIAATEAIVQQCLNHVGSATAKLNDRIARAAASSPMGRDMRASGEGSFRMAVENRVQHVETSSGALVANLNGLRLVLASDTFYALPCVTMARSIAEIASTTAWLLAGTIGVEERAARSYAAMFRSIDQGIKSTLPKDADALRNLRARMIHSLKPQGVQVLFREKAGVILDEVNLVRVGRAQAKTAYQYGPRIDAEIPSLTGIYSALSGMAHGEEMHASNSWDRPDTAARLVGVAVLRAVEAWSRAVHTWVGVTAGPFINPQDRAGLIASFPADLAEAFRGGGEVSGA